MVTANATVTAVAAQTTGEAYDGPVAAGASRWAGTAPAVVTTREVQQPDGTVANMTVLVVENAAVPTLWSAGDLVTFQRDGGPALIAQIADVGSARTRNPAASTRVQTTTATLRDIKHV